MTQPGEQDVIMGSTPPVVTRSMNSLASSMMVRSAAKSVSKTLSKPRRRAAATILPCTFVPIGMPKHSPRVTRTEGAVWTMTCFEGSRIAAQTFSVSSFSARAPVGHTTMHCPQDTHAVSSRGFSKAEAICVSKPLSLAPMTPIPCVSLQAATQRRQRTHLELSRYIWAAESSMGQSILTPLHAEVSLMP